MSRTSCTLSAIVLLGALCGPSQAQEAHKGTRHNNLLVDPISWLLTAAKDRIDHFLRGGGGCGANGALCPPAPLPPPRTDGGGGCDPNGIPACKP